MSDRLQLFAEQQTVVEFLDSPAQEPERIPKHGIQHQPGSAGGEE